MGRLHTVAILDDIPFPAHERLLERIGRAEDRLDTNDIHIRLEPSGVILLLDLLVEYLLFDKI